jgi:protease-4
MSNTDPDSDTDADTDPDPGGESATDPDSESATDTGTGSTGEDGGDPKWGADVGRERPDRSPSRTEEGTDPTALYERLQSLGGRLTRSYSAIVVVAVIVGVVLAPVVASVAAQGSSGTVAVIPLEGTIDGGSAAALAGALERARADPDIDAVVLQINSGGGSASASETMYLEISKTSEEMPVVSSVGSIAASGAYYAAVGSDRIFIKPASLAGNVGVLFTPPAQVEPNDIILTTGPSKLAGASERGWRYKTDALQEAFLSAVVEGRGDALEIPRERVATAELFTGAESVETGMADEIGTTRDAVEYAAAEAGLDSYDVEVIRPQESTAFLTRTAYLASDAPNRTMVSVRYFIGEESGNQYPNFLMIPPGVVAEELAERDRTGAAGPTATPGAAETSNGTTAAGTPNGTAVAEANATVGTATPQGAVALTGVDDGY